MPDPYSGGTGSTKQEIAIFNQAQELKKARVFSSEKDEEENSKDSEEKKGKKKLKERKNGTTYSSNGKSRS